MSLEKEKNNTSFVLTIVNFIYRIIFGFLFLNDQRGENQNEKNKSAQ